MNRFPASLLFWPVFSLVLTLAALPGFAAAQTRTQQDSPALHDAQRILNQLAQKHRASPNFALKFESHSIGSDGEPLPVVKGSLLSADSGCFRLDHAAGTVVCDGKTLWQYFPANKQVILKDAAEAGEAGGILLSFLEARALRAQRTQDGLLRIVLEPGSVGQNLDSLILTLDPDKSAVRIVETQDPTGSRVTYVVKSLRYGISVTRKDFVFQAPKCVETVDMR